MGRAARAGIGRETIVAYLRRRYGADAELMRVAPLSDAEAIAHKEFGYGEPTRVDFRVNGVTRSHVIHTMSPDQFGHDRRSDRVAAMVGAFDLYRGALAHVQPIDVGFIESGAMISAGTGEPFVVTEFAAGAMYGAELATVAKEDKASARDLERVAAIVRYIAAMRARPASRLDYRRSVRDVVGSGEGIFGLRDAYDDNDAVATPARLAALMTSACNGRERLRDFEHRGSQIHGDLHPYNVIFADDGQMRLLDRSRGGVGDIADDVTCMAVNYLALALREHGTFRGALRELWDVLWRDVIAAADDREIVEVVGVFFAWRVLVLACPLWYPTTPARVREQLLHFAERLLDGPPFTPSAIDELLQ